MHEHPKILFVIADITIIGSKPYTSICSFTQLKIDSLQSQTFVPDAPSVPLTFYFLVQLSPDFGDLVDCLLT